METVSPLFIVPILVGPIFLLAGWLLWRKPPKKINSLYGYRSRKSMENQAKWDFAQIEGGKNMMRAGLLYLLLIPIGQILTLSEIVETILSIGILFLIVVLLFLKTEKAIDKAFS
jgi:uncharacterized membrane protein